LNLQIHEVLEFFASILDFITTHTACWIKSRLNWPDHSRNLKHFKFETNVKYFLAASFPGIIENIKAS